MNCIKCPAIRDKDDIIEELRQENEQLHRNETQQQVRIEALNHFNKKYLQSIDSFTAKNIELEQQLEATQKLSEERRVALVELHDDNVKCYACKCWFLGDETIHKPNCDYCRLVKEDDNGN